MDEDYNIEDAEIQQEEQAPIEETQAEEPQAEEAQEQQVTSEGVKKKKKREKKKLTKEQKKQRAIKALIITGSIVLAFAIFISSVAIANVVVAKGLLEQAEQFTAAEYPADRLVPVIDPEDGYWTFTTDRELKIMQLTDVHIGGGSFSKQKDAWAMNAVATMIKEELPDLVIVTGDITFPVPYASGSFDNLHGVEIFSTLMEKLGVYWTFCFGNHDTEAYAKYTRTDICEYYEKQQAAGKLKYCLFQRGESDKKDVISDDSMGFGNTIIKVKNSAGDLTQALVMIDSHSYLDGDYFGLLWNYDYIHDVQVNWYEREMNRLGNVKNMIFFHIPIREYREAWKEYRENGNQNTDNVIYFAGAMRENEDKVRHDEKTYGVACSTHPDKLFETASQHNATGIFCGHDHYNNFSVEYKGIRLTYGMSIDYLAYPGIYKEHLQRGCTLINLDEDGSFEIEHRNYYKDYGAKIEKGKNELAA